MIYNYHTHTTRCHHAVDSDEEYIKAAIEAGIKYLGFSDHAPVVFSGGHGFHYHMDIEDGDEYVNTIRALAEKYKEDIHISVGFEMEYYPSYFEEMLNLARKFGVDYLILGQHFIADEYPDGVGSRAYTENPAHLKEYVDNVIKGIESGVFTYIAHPEIINFGGNDELYRVEMTRLCLEAKSTIFRLKSTCTEYSIIVSTLLTDSLKLPDRSVLPLHLEWMFTIPHRLWTKNRYSRLPKWWHVINLIILECHV